MKPPLRWVTKTVRPSGPPKARLVGSLAVGGNLPQIFAVRRHHHDRAFEDARDEEPAVDVGADAVDD